MSRSVSDSKDEIQEGIINLGILDGVQHYHSLRMTPAPTPTYQELTEVPVLSQEEIDTRLRLAGLEMRTQALHRKVFGIHHKIMGLDDKMYIFKAILKCGFITQRTMCNKAVPSHGIPVVALTPVREPISRFLAAVHQLSNWNFTQDQFVEYMYDFKDPTKMNSHLKPMSLHMRGNEVIFPITAYNDLFQEIIGKSVHRNARPSEVRLTQVDLTPRNTDRLMEMLKQDFVLWEQYKDRNDPLEILGAYHRKVDEARNG